VGWGQNRPRGLVPQRATGMAVRGVLKV